MPSLEPSPNGALALHYAAARGCLDCARLLVDTSTGLTANTQMENDVTPVYLAAQEGHLEVLKFLVLEAGGSLYIRAKDGMAPVHAAAQMGSLSCLKWMIDDQGVDPNLRDGDGATPLHFAASRGHVESVRWLLRHGALLLQDNYGKSPINDAAENQQMMCLNELVQHGTSPDYSEDARRYGRFHGCTCRISDPTNRCSYADCVNYATPHEPFYLHTKENAYMTPIGSVGQDPFYLHKPGQTSSNGYHRVRELFGASLNKTTPIELPQTPPPPPPQLQIQPISQGNKTTVRVEVHHEETQEDLLISNLETDLNSEPEKNEVEPTVGALPPSPPPLITTKLPPLPPQTENDDEGRGSTILEEHDYEDIYSVKGRDSGSHSRTPSMSSGQSDSPVVITTANDSSESGVSSPSPSELGNKSECDEPEKPLGKEKLEHRHSLPHQTSQNSRSLKRVVSVPVNISPPPPPPPPPSEDSSLTIIPTPQAPQTQQETPQTPTSNQNNSNDVVTSGGQIGHLVNKQMVLPFIPPKFGEGHDPEALIKPSEYLKSLQGGHEKGGQAGSQGCPPGKDGVPPAPPAPSVGPPPPPPPPPPHQQPLSTISIQDITSVQLKRTKNPAVKTMSCPHPSLPVESPFQHAKEDLIAELKLSRDISGIKKLKVERVKMEEKQGKEIASTISKKFTVDSFVEKVPDKDSAGNPIPAWKRQMLAKKAAEKARKEMEEELAKEAELKRLQAIPAWKRHLLQKKGPQSTQPSNEEVKQAPLPENKENKLPEPQEKPQEREAKTNDDEVTQIIPWRAQLRKTNSTLNLLE